MPFRVSHQSKVQILTDGIKAVPYVITGNSYLSTDENNAPASLPSSSLDGKIHSPSSNNKVFNNKIK